MRKLIEVLPWTEFLDVHLYKDTFTFISQFAKEYSLPCEIVFCDNPVSGIKLTEFAGIKLAKLENKYSYKNPPRLRHFVNFFRFLSVFKDYLKSQAGCFSHVMLFHITPYSLFLSKFIKREFKTAKIYVKADSSGVKGLSRHIFKRLLKYVDLISFESPAEVDSLNLAQKNLGSEKIVYIPNGFCEEESVPFDHSAKENVILSVARFGASPKNSELLLDTLAAVDLKDFKVVLAGPVEEEFNEYLKAFFERFPNLKGNIDFVGNIYDRSELYKLYQKSKIFVFTSRWESFGLVLLEAAWYGNFIISTDVGAASYLVRMLNGGFVAVENPNDEHLREKLLLSLSSALQNEIYNASKNQPLVNEKSVLKVHNEFAISKIVQKDCFKKFFSFREEL